jgi:hypothetical protein
MSFNLDAVLLEAAQGLVQISHHSVMAGEGPAAWEVGVVELDAGVEQRE